MNCYVLDYVLEMDIANDGSRQKKKLETETVSFRYK